MATLQEQQTELRKSICVVGSGAAGLITAYTLLKDGFTNVDVITRDKTPGGIWSEDRVYSGLALNNVHGEFHFTALPMPPPSDAEKTGGRLTGESMCAYMTSFADRFLNGKIQYETDVLNIRCLSQPASPSEIDGKPRWAIRVHVRNTDKVEEWQYHRVVLCTGGCSEPRIPPELSPTSAKEHGFRGLVLHTSQIKPLMRELMDAVRPKSDPKPGMAVVIGAGKSAQDAARFLALNSRQVCMVFERADGFLASTTPVPGFLRKSRMLALMSPHIELRTILERLLHRTWLGSKVTHAFWDVMQSSSFHAVSMPQDSPLRNIYPPFWSFRVSDEGVPRPDGFHALVREGKIKLIAPARMVTYADSPDGHSIVLSDGQKFEADAVIVATGYESSWAKIIDDETRKELGLDRHPPIHISPEDIDKFSHLSLDDPEHNHHTPATDAEWGASIYRGIIPAKNILRRDFAINGATHTTHNGYSWETASHWIASYFRKDPFMTRLPKTPAAAIYEAEKHNAWVRKRSPGALTWMNESYSPELPYFNWPQMVDRWLEDMNLPIMRSGGNWLTWPFKIISIDEIAHLTEERAKKREEYLR